jgi:hypothetical protein
VRFALYIQNGDEVDLLPFKAYRVLPDRRAANDRYLRVIDESGEDYLYPASCFVLVDLPRKAIVARPRASRPTRRPGPAR